jgi:multidrug resistance efflux pump
MSDADPRLIGLTTLLQLEKEARHAEDLLALGFVLVNETRHLLEYQQAVWWHAEEVGRAKVAAISGVATLDRDAPYPRWLEGMLAEHQGGDQPRPITQQDLAEAQHPGWQEWLPAHGLICPLHGPQGQPLGGLWLTRERPWTPAELALLDLLLDSYGHAWWALRPDSLDLAGNLGRLMRRRRGRLLLLGLLVALALLPMRQSALAPAEVTPRDPLVVASPYEGVVERFHVQPNQTVERGDLLFELDDTLLRNRLEITRKELAVAEAEYLKASRKAFQDSRTKGEVALLEARRELRLVEVAYTEELLARIRVTAPRAGVAVFNDVNDWTGRPVSVGEKVLTLADPRDSELEIQLPVADAVNVQPGAEVLLFLDTDPTRPHRAELTRSAYQAQPTPAGILAFRLKARFLDPQARPRIGLQGSARIYGERTLLFYHVMRRPIAVVRQWLGL